MSNSKLKSRQANPITTDYEIDERYVLWSAMLFNIRSLAAFIYAVVTVRPHILKQNWS